MNSSSVTSGYKVKASWIWHLMSSLQVDVPLATILFKIFLRKNRFPNPPLSSYLGTTVINSWQIGWAVCPCNSISQPFCRWGREALLSLEKSWSRLDKAIQCCYWGPEPCQVFTISNDLVIRKPEGNQENLVWLLSSRNGVGYSLIRNTQTSLFDSTIVYPFCLQWTWIPGYRWRL